MKGKRKRKVEDVISPALNDVERPVNPRHVHVFRKEYRTCLINGCRVTPSFRAEDERFD